MLSPVRALQIPSVVSVQIDALTKHFGAIQALDNVSLALNEGEMVSITGPSGAGKSTLARMISGLEAPNSGHICIGGQDITSYPPQARRVAHMFESFALYPTRTVRENVASPLTAPANRGRWNATQIAHRLDEVLALTEMTSFGERLPSQLSGGQKQRVALCRALVQDPSVYVLDEPIGHLDAKLRHQLRGDIRRRQRQLRPGTLWLTPDGLEAMAVADRMVVMIKGRVQQTDTPERIYSHPANVQVARLIGDPAMNILPITWLDEWHLSPGTADPVRASAALIDRHRGHASGNRGVLGLRPAELQLAPSDALAQFAGTTDRFPATVYAVEPLGKSTIVSLDLGGQRLRARVPGNLAWPPGTQVTMAFDAARALSFDADSEALCS